MKYLFFQKCNFDYGHIVTDNARKYGGDTLSLHFFKGKRIIVHVMFKSFKSKKKGNQIWHPLKKFHFTQRTYFIWCKNFLEWNNALCFLFDGLKNIFHRAFQKIFPNYSIIPIRIEIWLPLANSCRKSNLVQ